MVGASKRRPSTTVVGAGCATREGDLSSLPPLIREKVMKDKRKPAELIRTDLITAMKIPDTEHLDPECYWLIVDPWKTDYDKGVQVPVNLEGAPDIVVKQRKDTTARDAILGPFFMPAKLINVNGVTGAMFDPARHEFCDAAVKARQLDARPRYNLDQLDFAWLQLLNRERGACGLLELTEEVLEMVVDDLETRCHTNMTANQLGIEFDENTQCDVCLSPDSEEGNDMVFCDACDLCVHQACYGIVTVPAGSWLCAPCARGYSAKPACALCPLEDGALKPDADADLWAHVTCALWIPEVTIGTPELMEPLQNLHKIPTWRRRLTCSVCGCEGQGACIQCSFENCKAAYHVTCAQKAGLSLLMCAADVNNPLLELKSFCHAHVKYRSATLAPHRYKKVIEYGGQAANSPNANKRNHSPANSSSASMRHCGNSASSASSANGDEVLDVDSALGESTEGNLSTGVNNLGGQQQFLDFVDPNETAAHLRQFVDPLGVDQIFNFWKLKRLERQGRALLPPKHEENSGLQRPVQIDDELSNTIRSLVNLRQDLERARNLSYLVQRREKQRKLWIRAREDVTMGQLRAAEEHPESLRIIRTANRLDDIYDRLHSFEKVYGVPAASVVTSLKRTVERDNVKVHGGSPISRIPAPSVYTPAITQTLSVHPSVARESGQRTVSINPGRFRPPPLASSVSSRGLEIHTTSKRRREQYSPEGDENNAPFRVRTRLNFSTTVDVVSTATAAPEKQHCTHPIRSPSKRHRASTPTTPVPRCSTASITGTANGSSPTSRISTSSTMQATARLRYLRVGRRRGGPFKRSMVLDLQSGSPERPLPPTIELRSPTVSVRQTPAAAEALSSAASQQSSPARLVSSPTIYSGSIRQQPPHTEQLPNRRLEETAPMSDGTVSAIASSMNTGSPDQHSKKTSLATSQSLRIAVTSSFAGAADTAQASCWNDANGPLPTNDVIRRSQHLSHNAYPVPSLAAANKRRGLAESRPTRGRRSLADTPVADLEGHFIRGIPKRPTEAIQLCSHDNVATNSRVGEGSPISNTSNLGSENHKSSNLESTDADSDTESVEILTGVEVLQLRTRNLTRNATLVAEAPAGLSSSSSSKPAYGTGHRKQRHQPREEGQQQNPLPDAGTVTTKYSENFPVSSGTTAKASATHLVASPNKHTRSTIVHHKNSSINASSSSNSHRFTKSVISNTRVSTNSSSNLSDRPPHFRRHHRHQNRSDNHRYFHQRRSDQQRPEIRTLRSSRDKVAAPKLLSNITAVPHRNGGVPDNRLTSTRQKGVSCNSQYQSVDCTDLNDGVTGGSNRNSSSKGNGSGGKSPKSTEGRHLPVRAAQTHFSTGTTKAVDPVKPTSTMGDAFSARESRQTRNRVHFPFTVTPNDVGEELKVVAKVAAPRLSRTEPLRITTPPSSPNKSSHPPPRLNGSPVAEPLMLRSNAKKAESVLLHTGQASTVSANRSDGVTYGKNVGLGRNKSLQYSLCYFDCTVRLQRLSGAQLQRFVRIVPKRGITGRAT
ncbi:PHD finger protein rhinoceros-like isoform X2 [Varroa jacobsoni]|nr:PHD finger protein rhinoceros-like isoform X2 [Varroa jacobsoni]XP_022711068.1 PHD finger protein rhinoceros-like isoform X2 [Varroa jacobsoni]